jgi:hypothetical protein
MKRRRFLQAVAATPAASALVIAQQPPSAPATTQPPATQPPPGFRGGPTAVEKLQSIAPDVAAEPSLIFFSATQFATLRKLGEVLMPPLKGNPGALDAGAPEFLDFLIGASPADRQKLYRNGLDSLNNQAKKQFGTSFAEVDPSQAAAILRPLLVVIEWPQDLPKDPVKHFVAQVHQDLRTATMNSREWANAGGAGGSGGRRRFGGTGLYWNPIDPVVKS